MDECIARLANSACGQWGWLDGLMDILDSGRPFFVFLACVLLVPLAFLRGSSRSQWLTGLLAAWLALVSANLAGRFVAGTIPRQPRPVQVLALRLPRGVSAQALLLGRPDTSLPSTHAITGGAVGLCLVWCRPVLGALIAAVGGLLMIAPVLYLGLHWPSDIAAGLGIAACAGWCCSLRHAGLARSGERLDGALRRWPLASSFTLTLLSTLVVWRVTPRTGIMDALTSAVRALVIVGRIDLPSP